MLHDANSLLVIDESFIDFIGNDSLCDNSYSMRSLIYHHDNVIIIHSFTKFYAVPGLRIGAAFANPSLIKKLSAYIPSWSVNTLSQAYITAAVNDTNYIKNTKDLLANEFEFMYKSLSAIDDLIVYKPSANYIWIEVQNPTITVDKDHTHNVELIRLLSPIFEK